MSESLDVPQDVALDHDVPESGPPCPKQLVARYGQMGYLGVFGHDLENPPIPNTPLVLRTGRGAELGRVLVNITPEPALFAITPDQLESFLELSGPEYPVSRGGRVLRVATPQDLNDQAHLDKSAYEEAASCREQIRQLNLDMRVVAVEHLLGGERIIFYFTSEQRIDFRDLVKSLATQYHTRIEMRQVGARDEARLVADYERCGRRCCCQEYLKLLKPVSMKMAKCQKATLDPTKISGRCGRLMCCLRHEDETYTFLTKQLPRKNIWVKTADGTVGKVIDSQIMTQLVRLMMPDGSPPIVVPNEEIVERNVPEPPPQPVVERRRPPRVHSEMRPLRSEQPSTVSEEAQPPNEPVAESTKDVQAAPLAASSTEPVVDEPHEQRADAVQADDFEQDEAGEETGAQPAMPPQIDQGQGEQGQDGQGRRRRRRGRRGRRHPESLSAPPQLNQGGARNETAAPAAGPDQPQGQNQGAPGQGRRRRHRHRGGRRPDGQSGPPVSPPPPSA